LIFNNQFVLTIKIFSKKCNYSNLQIDIYFITNKNKFMEDTKPKIIIGNKGPLVIKGGVQTLLI